MRCLVIEDESITGHYICNGLKEAGHTPSLVRDGVSGLQLATSQSWDVVVLDRMLPGGVDDLSLTKIRELGKTTPLLILSALASLDERLRGLRAGGDDYLTKPFAFSELLARLEALPRRNTMRTESSELRIADLKLDLRTRRVERAGKSIALNRRELLSPRAREKQIEQQVANAVGLTERAAALQDPHTVDLATNPATRLGHTARAT